jgi:hypothetical protein
MNPTTMAPARQLRYLPSHGTRLGYRVLRLDVPPAELEHAASIDATSARAPPRRVH